MIIHEFDLDMVPGGPRVEQRLNQYDSDFSLKIHLVARSGEFTIADGTTVAIRGTKPDGNGYSVSATINTKDAIVTVAGDQQITAADGKAIFELTLYSGGKELNTANFILNIERAALDKDTLESGSEIRELVNVIDRADEIIAAGKQCDDAKVAIEKAAEEISGYAEAAAGSAEEAKKTKQEISDFYDEAIKAIDEKSQAIAALTTDADQVAKQALERVSNVENEAAEYANDIESLKRTDEATQLTLEGKIDDAYVENGYLYLTSNGEVVAGPLGPFSGSGGGGGGSSGNNAVLSVTNQTGWLSKTIANGDVCPVTILWSSTEDEIPTGDGTARITVNGAIKAVLNIQQGMVTIDLAPYISNGSNVVKVTISDVYDNSRTINFSVTSIAISISSSFDASVPYQGAISFPYTPVGSVQKTVHFLLDSSEIGQTTTSVSGRQMSYTVPPQKHGAHTLEVYFDCDINGQTVESNHLYYEIICLEVLNLTPIIVSSFHLTEAMQYTMLHVDYTVYDPAALTAPVTISVNGAQVSEQTVDRTQQVFTYRADETGPLSIVIASGETSKTIELTITESTIHVDPVTEALALYLSSAGRSNNEAKPGSWSYNDIEAGFSGFNFKSDGWVNDEDGVTVLRVAGSARVKIPLQIFAKDFRSTGKTIEIEFATRNVMDYDSVILSCLSGGRGISLTAQKAMLASEQSEISMQYKEDEHVRISFVVEKRSENRLIYIYVNGIMSGVVQYPDTDDFSQAEPVDISIGSDDCTIDLYCIRVYDNDLTWHQLLDNWIADTQTVSDMLSRYQRNSVYDDYGNIVIAQLPSDLPYMVIECQELPQYKGDKKTVSINYVDPVTTSKGFVATGAEADVQGTSSQYYARKNYKIKFMGGFTLSSGSHVSTYSMRADSIPTNVFTFKADVASSEGANNVELARLYNDICPYKTPPQKQNDTIRQGIDGFPIVVFWNNGEETTFLGKYNFNNDKSTEEVFGFADGDESWEILNNTSGRVLWKDADYSTDDWQSDFEARYPDGSLDKTKLQALAEWLVSTDQSAVESDDEKAERLQKFKTELSQYIEKDSATFYYVFTELFLMVDSRAKNAFPSIFGEDKWCFLPYDFDTALGINNEGALVFGYELEDIDHTESGADIFNGQQSVLWTNLRQAFFDDIAAMYQTLRSTGALSYDKVETMFEEHQAKWPEAIFNEDAWFKYLAPLVESGSGAYLAMLQGSKAEQRKWWLYNRFRYIDSKYNAGDALSDVIQIRGYAKTDVTVTPYADVYASVKYGSYLTQKRAKRKEACTLPCTLENVNDTEIYIYSASQLASVGDLSGFKVGYADFSKATKLQSLKLGDEAEDYDNGNLKELYMGNNILLRSIDLRGCSGLGTGDMKSVDISGCVNVEEVYCEGTAITGIDLPNGGVLRVLHLPATVTNLTILNQPSMTDLTIPSYDNITTLRLENVGPAIDTEKILRAIPASSRVRITGFYWEAADADEISGLFDILDKMRGLDEFGNNMDTAQMSGTIHTDSLTGAEIAEFNARYPFITVAADHTTSNLYYYNYDGSQLLYTETVKDGGDGGEYKEKPARSSTAQYTYTFAGWSKSMDATKADADALKKVTADRNVYAAYTATVRTYTVTWRNNDNTILETDENVPYGTTPHYDGATPSSSTGEPFQGWTPPVGPITGNTTYTATYVPTYTVYFYSGNQLLQTVTGVRQGGSATYTEATPQKTDVEDPENWEFTGWVPAPTNIQGNTSCYAQFRMKCAPWADPSFSVANAYAVQWTYNVEAHSLPRGGLAADFEDPVPATSLTDVGSSPFNNIMPWSGMKRYNIIDGEISYSEDDDGFDQEAYDTVVHIPEFYFRAEKDTDNSRWTWAISPTEQDGFTKHPGSDRYIGRYHTSGDADGVFTKSKVNPLVNTSQTNFRVYSRNKGEKWHMLDIATWSALQMLYLVEYADFGSQETLGTGYVGKSSVGAGGGTDEAVYHTLKMSSDHNQYRWVEDPFSNCYDWIDCFVGKNGSSGNTYVATDDTGYNGGQTGLTALGFALPSSGAIRGFGYSEDAPWAFIPDASDTSDSKYETYVCDRVNSDSLVYPAYVGGYYYTYANFGLFCFGASYSASYTYGNLGSRLLYVP